MTEDTSKERGQGRPGLSFSVSGSRRDFTCVANSALRDERLSYRAKGILSACLSHDPSFEFTRAWIESHGTEGRDAIRAALRELRDLGYLKNVKSRDSSGRVSGERYVFTDVPALEEGQGLSTENQQPEKPAAGFPGRIRIPIEENQIKPPLSPLQAQGGSSKANRALESLSKLEMPEWLEPYREHIYEWQQRRKAAHKSMPYEISRLSLKALEYARELNCLEPYMETVSEKPWVSLGFDGYRAYIENVAGKGPAKGQGKMNNRPIEVNYTLTE